MAALYRWLTEHDWISSNSAIAKNNEPPLLQTLLKHFRSGFAIDSNIIYCCFPTNISGLLFGFITVQLTII